MVRRLHRSGTITGSHLQSGHQRCARIVHSLPTVLLPCCPKGVPPATMVSSEGHARLSAEFAPCLLLRQSPEHLSRRVQIQKAAEVF